MPLEYLLIGLATALFGVLAGTIAAWFVVTRLMTLSFVFEAASAGGRGRLRRLVVRSASA